MAGITIYIPTTTSAVADPVLVSNGTAAAPSYSFTSDPTTGMYLSAVGTLAFANAGVLGMSLTSGVLTAASGYVAAAAGAYSFTGRSQLQSAADGYVQLLNAAGTGFTALRFGGTSASFPMLRRTTTALNVRLADDSADGGFTAGAVTLSDNLTMTTTKTINWGASQTKVLNGAADGDFVIQSSTGTASTLYMGPSSGTGGMRIRATTNSMFVERSDGSAFAGNFTLSQLSVAGQSTLNSGNTTNIGIQFGAGAPAARVDYSGTSGRYYMRDGSGVGGTTFITQGQYCVLKTTAYTVVTLDSGVTFQNTGAGGQVVYTLPAATAGQAYTFINTAAGATFTKALAVGTDIIAYNGAVGAAAGSLTSAAIWTSFKLVCHSAGVWVATAVVGTPTLA